MVPSRGSLSRQGLGFSLPYHLRSIAVELPIPSLDKQRKQSIPLTTTSPLPPTSRPPSPHAVSLQPEPTRLRISSELGTAALPPQLLAVIGTYTAGMLPGRWRIVLGGFPRFFRGRDESCDGESPHLSLSVLLSLKPSLTSLVCSFVRLSAVAVPVVRRRRVLHR